MIPAGQLLILPRADRDDIARRVRALPPRRRDLRRNPFTARIIHINDFHNAIARRDERGQWSSRLPALHNLLESRREEFRRGDDGSVFFVSAGDDMVGSLWDYLIRDREGEYRCHGAYHFLSLLGLDVSVAGNHDFDNGSALLRTAIEGDARFPVLSANLRDSPELQDVIHPAAIVSAAGVRIGILGLTTMGQQRGSRFNRYRISPPLEAAREWIPILRQHCDAVVLLSHLGSTVASTFAEVIDHGDFELAAALGEHKPDLIIGGHTHELYQTTSRGVPVTQAGCNGQWAGEVELLITGEANFVRFFPVIPLEPDFGTTRFYQDHIAPFLARHLPSIETIPVEIGAGACPVDVDLPQCKGYRHCSIAGFLTEVLLARLAELGYPVDLVLLDGTVVNDLIPTDAAVDAFDIFRLLPYSDSVYTLEFGADELVRLIADNENRARIPGEEYREKGFLYFSGNIRWDADESGSITNVRINGRSIDTNGVYTAATTHILRALAVHWEREQEVGLFSVPMEHAKDTGLFLRDEILAYLVDHPREFAPCDPVRFVSRKNHEPEGLR